MISDQNQQKARSLLTPKLQVPSTQKPSGPTGTSSPAIAQRSDSIKTASTSLGQVRNTSPGEAGGTQQPVLVGQAAAAAKNRGVVLTKPDDIFRHELSSVPGAKEKYAALNENQRTQFDQLVRSQFVEGTKVNTAPGNSVFNAMQKDLSDQERATLLAQGKGTGARRGLVSLLAQGKLTRTDGKDQTLLQNLTQLNEKPIAEGRDRQALLQGVIQDTAYMPGVTGNVAKGEFNKTLAREKPAEYARVVRELASPDGKSQLGSSNLVSSESKTPDSKTPVAFGPSASSQLFQNSLDESTAREQLFRQEVMGDSKRGEAYSKLSPGDQQKFQVLYQKTIPNGDHPKMPGQGGLMGYGMGGFSKGEVEKPSEAELAERQKAMKEFQSRRQVIDKGTNARAGLTSLLEKGTLSQKDSQGQSLIDNLHSIQRQDMASENGHTLNRQEVLSEVIHQIDDPGTIRQNNKGTCTVTTVEHLLASRQPAEYARVMGQLTSKDGSVTLQDGTTVPREKGIVPPDDSNRSNVSRIFQATMMEHGNGAKVDYRNDEDGHYRVETGEAILNSHGKLSSGLSMENWSKVSDSIMGTKSDVREGTLQSGKRGQIEQDIANALGDNRMVQVGMRWSIDEKDGKHGYHALSVTGQDKDYIYLRNPWGSGDMGSTDSNSTLAREVLRPNRQSKSPAPFSMFGTGFAMNDQRPVANPEHSKGEAGSIRVKKEEFYGKLSSYIVEEKQTESSWYDRLNPF